MEYILIFLSAIVVMIVSLAGIIFTNKNLGVWLNKNLKLLVGFSAGVFLIVAYRLIDETFTHNNWQTAVFAILLGIILTALLNKILPETHHHDSGEVCEHHLSANRILFGDSIHNITDGFILVSAYLISIQTGIIVTIGVIIHEAIQEISEFFVYKKAGLSDKSALTKNLISSSTILLGVTIGILVVNLHSIEAFIVGIAAGSFLYVFIVDLLPNIRKAVLYAVLGALFFSAINFFVGGHSHGNEIDVHDEDGHDKHEQTNHHDEHDEHEQ